ncbi:uncharacterized protein LOC109529767 [Hippocampus comes]|uniref:uncharacterized protein LOC109529767 n=1 Tax=Hippocampus comes TaxID=109280 RepID=UPI00094E7EF3|nr:PREDICTED: uncharacterized protein LOC109529767 [Hippocampus comes]
MTTTTTSPDGSPRELAAVLVDVYRRCLSARADTARPKRDAEELARAILDGVRAHRRHGDGAADASCLALTLVGRAVAEATAGTPRDARFRRDVLEALLRDSDVVSRMVAEFGCEHPVLRHLAAKSASACVLYQLQVSGSVHPEWRGTCERALLSLPAGPELDSCLWSLTSVLQKLLRDHRQELVGTLVTVFDASVGVAARRFLSADRSARGAGGAADTFCLLLDLLEILAASGPAPSGGARSPHLTHVHAAALLAAVNRVSQQD